MMTTNPDHVYGCYCYSTECGHTVVHVFTNGARKCGCGERELKLK